MQKVQNSDIDWLSHEVKIALLGHRKLEITQRYLNVTDVGVVRSMRELWARRRTVARAQA